MATDTQKNTSIGRREFLQTAAVLGAGFVIGKTALAQDEEEGEQKTQPAAAATTKNGGLNIALIGAGAQGQVLIDACRNIPGIQFKAICDIWESYNLKRAVGKFKQGTVNGYVDYQDMLSKEKNLDAVLIATPDFCHADQTVNCLKAGLHVYCEKEMSNTLEGAKKMVAAAKETKKLLQIGHQRRSNPMYIYCHDKILKEARLLNRITTINGQWNRAMAPDLGTPKKYEIDPAILTKYGYKSMAQFRNWRWFKGMGGGAIVDLGAHQIDVYNWFLGAVPKAVMASGGTDYYDKATHEWYDSVQALYEYEYEYEPGKKQTVRAFYQTITTNSNGGYYEAFMGDQGTLTISEAGKALVYREPSLDDQAWEKWVKGGLIKSSAKKESKSEGVVDVRTTVEPPKYDVPVKLEKKIHEYHLGNFFDTIRGKAKLTCPAEVAFESAVSVLKVNDAIEAGRRLEFKPEEFKV